MVQYIGQVLQTSKRGPTVLIIQVTLGCSHNKCTFCGSFRQKPFQNSKSRRNPTRPGRRPAIWGPLTGCFLADGDALCITSEAVS